MSNPLPTHIVLTELCDGMSLDPLGFYASSILGICRRRELRNLVLSVPAAAQLWATKLGFRVLACTRYRHCQERNMFTLCSGFHPVWRHACNLQSHIVDGELRPSETRKATLRMYVRMYRNFRRGLLKVNPLELLTVVRLPWGILEQSSAPVAVLWNSRLDNHA